MLVRLPVTAASTVAVFIRRRIPAAYLLSTKSSMTSDSSGTAFTTIEEIVSLEKEIKKSKFIAIAGPISSEQSAQLFLSQVRDPRATHNCWAYKVIRLNNITKIGFLNGLISFHFIIFSRLVINIDLVMMVSHRAQQESPCSLQFVHLD